MRGLKHVDFVVGCEHAFAARMNDGGVLSWGSYGETVGQRVLDLFVDKCRHIFYVKRLLYLSMCAACLTDNFMCVSQSRKRNRGESVV